MEVENEVINMIEEFCNENGYSFRDDYSGRGMFGQTCVGYVTDDPMLSLLYLGDYLREEFDDCSANLLNNDVKTDNMGCSTIVYFPHLRRK